MWNIECAIGDTIFGLRLSKHWRRHINRWTLYIANMTPWATLGRGFAFTRFGQWFEVAKRRPISSLLPTPTTKLSFTKNSIYENRNITQILPMREISDWNEITGTFLEPAIMVAIACRTSLTAAAVDITTIVPFRVTTEVPSIDLLASTAQSYEFAVTWIDWANSRYLIPAFSFQSAAARAANATTVVLGTVDPRRPVRQSYTRSSFVTPASQITNTFQYEN